MLLKPRTFKNKVPKPLRILIRRKAGIFSLTVLAIFIIMATIGAEMIPKEALYRNPSIASLPPSFEHPLGTDWSGRDIFALIVHGSRSVMFISFLGASFTILIGSIIGITAGYIGGNVDKILGVITDIALTLPGLVLFIVLASFFRRTDTVTFSFLLSITAWGGLARALRSQTLSLKQQEFVEAARALGLSAFHIIFREIMPNLLPYIGTNFLFAVIYCIYMSVGLFYLGLTTPDIGVTNWGMMLNQAISQGIVMIKNPMHMIFLLAPITAIILLTVSLVLLAGIKELFNPRLSEEE